MKNIEKFGFLISLMGIALVLGVVLSHLSIILLLLWDAFNILPIAAQLGLTGFILVFLGMTLINANK